jgi:hypothetical protein
MAPREVQPEGADAGPHPAVLALGRLFRRLLVIGAAACIALGALTVHLTSHVKRGGLEAAVRETIYREPKMMRAAADLTAGACILERALGVLVDLVLLVEKIGDAEPSWRDWIDFGPLLQRAREAVADARALVVGIEPWSPESADLRTAALDVLTPILQVSPQHFFPRPNERALLEAAAAIEGAADRLEPAARRFAESIARRFFETQPRAAIGFMLLDDAAQGELLDHLIGGPLTDELDRRWTAVSPRYRKARQARGCLQGNDIESVVDSYLGRVSTLVDRLPGDQGLQEPGD